MSRRNRPVTKDMYWFAHGGSEAMINNKNVVEEETESNSIDRKAHNEELKSLKDISLTDGSNSSGPPSLERDDRLHSTDKRLAVEERRKLLLEAEQERNDAMMRKHMEREAALEARRNANRSTISFAFGSSVPRNVDTLQSNHSVETDCMSRSFTAGSSSNRAELDYNFYDRRSVSPIHSSYMVNGTTCHRPDTSSLLSTHSNIQSGCLVGSGAIFVEDVMSKSMTAASAPRGRRKNDLMPTVPYDRTAAPRVATSSSSRRRSVSMTRLDQLAQPRKHYVEATTKANSTTSTSSMLKDGCSPNRPLSSASEHSGGRAASNVTRRPRTAPRKPRPVSIAGTIPDHKLKLHEVKGNALKKTPAKKTEAADAKKAPSTSTTPKSYYTPPKLADKPKPAARPTTAPPKASTPKAATPKPTPPPKTTAAAKPKTPQAKDKPSSAKPQTSKTPTKKKTEVQVSSAKMEDDVKVERTEKSGSPLPDSDSGGENEKNSKRIISEEEAKAALAEKRRLAREQAEREAEIERQRQEELKRLEEERLRQEEEEQHRMEEESMRLLEEHRRQEEEKLRRAIEDQEQKKEEERARQEEESRLKAEQDKKAKEEAEKIRFELEEKLRREEEERAERKKRLEKIMSRTRGKSSGTSPSGSVSGSDHMDSGDNQQEGFSSGATSLESNEGAHSPGEPVSSDDAMMAKMEVSSSGGNSLEANLTYEFSSNDVSLNSNDLMLPASEVASRENSMIVASGKELGSAVAPINTFGGVGSSSDQFSSETEDKVNNPVLEEEKIIAEVDVSESKYDDEFENQSVSTNSENTAERVEVEQKLEKEVIAFDETPNPSCNDKYVEELSYNETSELHNAQYNQFDSEIIKPADEANLIADDDYPATITQSSDNYVDNELSGIDQGSVVEDILYEPTLGFNTSAPDAHQTPFDDQNEENTEIQGSAMLPAASEITSAEAESKLDQLSETNQDPLNDLIVQEPMLVSDNKQEQDYVEQPREIGENLIVSSQANVSTDEKEGGGDALKGAEFSIVEQEQVQFSEGDAFNLSSENQNFNSDVVGDGEVSAHLHSTLLSNSDGVNVTVDNPFSTDFGGGDAVEAFKAASDVHLDNPFVSNFDGMDSASQAFNSEKTEAVSVDNPFASNYVSNQTEQNLFNSQIGDCDSKEPSEHIGFEDSSVDKDNVTLIKQEGGEKYVGIISSIDNDHFSNSFPNKLNGQLTNNLECASTTDESEDSSLDSNLSQVIAPEADEKDIVNNHHHQTSNNTDNPFMNHQSSIPQSGVDHYSEFEVYSNGHSVESSKMVTDYGNGILSVDKNNIFENVEAMDKKMISSDPFLAKGSSNQISGNPFLMQEEQNPPPKVLMTSDFLN